MNKKLLWFPVIASLILLTAAVQNCSAETGKTAELELIQQGIDAGNDLYIAEQPENALKTFEEILPASKKSDVREYLRVLVYIMRIQYEQGDTQDGEKTRTRIDREIIKIKDPEFIKNLFMARASIYANAQKFDEAQADIKRSLRSRESMENLLTAAMIAARFQKKDDAYKLLDRAFSGKDMAGETLEGLIMKNITAAIICLGLEDMDSARTYIDFVIENLHKTVDNSYFLYVYKSLLNNIFSFFEHSPANIDYYEKIYKMAIEKENKKSAGEMCINIASILAGAGARDAAAEKLNEALKLLDIEGRTIDANVSYETIEHMNKIAAALMRCGEYKKAAALFESMTMVYEKKGNLKDSFEKIRKLSYCKFRAKQSFWRPLMEELMKTAAETHETLELLLTQNALGEALLETGENGLAYKYFDQVFEAIDSKKPDDCPSSEYAELYFSSIYNLIRVAAAGGNTEKALNLISKYEQLYEKYKTQNQTKKKKTGKRSDSIKNFVVIVEFSVSEISSTSGKVKLEKARIMKAMNENEEAFKAAVEASELLKKGESSAELLEAAGIAASFEKFKNLPEAKKLAGIASKYKEIKDRYSTK